MGKLLGVGFSGFAVAIILLPLKYCNIPSKHDDEATKYSKLKKSL